MTMFIPCPLKCPSKCDIFMYRPILLVPRIIKNAHSIIILTMKQYKRVLTYVLFLVKKCYSVIEYCCCTVYAPSVCADLPDYKGKDYIKLPSPQ